MGLNISSVTPSVKECNKQRKGHNNSKFDQIQLVLHFVKSKVYRPDAVSYLLFHLPLAAFEAYLEIN